MRKFRMTGTAIDNNAMIRMRDQWLSLLHDEVHDAGYIPYAPAEFVSSYTAGAFKWTLTVPAILMTE